MVAMFYMSSRPRVALLFYIASAVLKINRHTVFYSFVLYKFTFFGIIYFKFDTTYFKIISIQNLLPF